MRKLSVSNLAWATNDEDKVFDRLNELNIQGIEVAPTKVFGPWEEIDLNDVAKYAKFLTTRQLEASSLQAILFQKNVNIFDRSHHSSIIQHFKLLSEIAYHLNIKNMVFGAPKTRKRNSLSYTKGMDIALELFEKLANVVSTKSARIVLEANPIDYGCDFLTCHSDVIDFVNTIDSDGIGFHIDTGALKMTSDSGIREYFSASAKHCHVSLPQLAPIVTDQEFIKYCMQSIPENYNNWIVLEMLEPESLNALFESLALFSEG